MKIGEFANLFDVKKETIRFYTDKNLLTPVKIGSFYDYDRNCVEDMKTILQLKDMDFNLEEISKYLSFFRISTKNMIAMKKELVDLFKDKIADVDDKIKEYQKAQKELSQKLEVIIAFEDYEEGREKELGFPLDFLSHLFCPDCGEPLKVINGEISSNYLMEGQFSCDCGYKAKIVEGILVFEGATFKNPFEEQPEFNDQEKNLTPEYISAVSTSSRWIIEQMLKEDLEGKLLFDHSTQSGIMANRLIDALTEKNPNFTYIGMDTFFTLIKNFKKILSMNDVIPRTIFLCGNYDKIPLQNSSCDYVSSCFGLQSYSIYNMGFPVDKVLSFLKSEG
ncbi:MAG: MerR family transcriptional regulator, partial [Thermotogota bacterium]